MSEKTVLSRSLKSGFGLLILAVVLLVSIALLSTVSNVRLDLTEDRLYTLSDGTKNILSSIEGEPLHLSFFYSKKITQEVPVLRAYAKRVEEMLREYEMQSDGKVVLHVIDPEPFSEEEDQAALYGLQGVPTGQNDMIYFGLVGERSVAEGEGARQELIEFFNPEKEEFLEYDISQLIYRLAQDKPLVVGVISSLPIFQHMNMQTRQREEPKIIMEQLRQMFDIKRMYDTSIEKIDEEIDLLMLVHPHLWPQETLYAIDQFVLRGGRLLVFMDPDAQLDEAEGAMFQGFQDRSSSLEQLLTAWGVEYDSKKILLDYKFAHSIPVTRYGQVLPHVGVIGIEGEGINREESMTANVEQINLATTGVIQPIEGATTNFVPLLQSSNEAQLIDVQEYSGTSNHGELLRLFQADGHGPYTLAAFVNGSVKSAFPEGRPVINDEADAEGDTVSNEGTSDELEGGSSNELPEHLNQSEQDIAVVLFADTDILDDRMWAQVQDFFGQKVVVPWAGNSDLIVNVLEKLSGSVDLINVRSRGTYHRPFSRVDELERQASERFRAEEERLLVKLEETEARLMELNTEPDPAVSMVEPIELTPEQQAEIDKFERERMEIRKNLREVQHRLNKDIEVLGTRLKIINIALIPFLLVVLSLLMAILKSRRAVSV